LYLIETLKNNVVGRDNVDHEVFWHRLDLEVERYEELLVESGVRSDVGTVREDPEEKIKTCIENKTLSISCARIYLRSCFQ
jgi:hypothetical protein